MPLKESIAPSGRRFAIVRRIKRARGLVLAHPLISTIIVVGVFAAVYAYVGLHLQQRRLVSMFDNVAGGVVASILTYGIIQAVFLRRSAYSLRQWLAFGRRSVWIIPTALEHTAENRYMPHPYYVVPPFDAQATGILVQVLRHAKFGYPLRKTVGSHYFDSAILKDNLVILCLPTRNQYARIFLGLFFEIYIEGKQLAEVTTDRNIQRYIDDTESRENYFGLDAFDRAVPPATRSPSSIEWKMLNFGDTSPNRWMTSTVNADGIVAAHAAGAVATDYALLVKAPNPFNHDSGVLLVCGIHGIGTLGASLYVYKHADELLGSFGEDAQAHLLRVQYAIPRNRENYIDAEIHPPIDVVSSRSLGSAQWYRRRGDSPPPPKSSNTY